MALGFLASWMAAGRLFRLAGRTPDDLAPLVTWLMISGVLGARIAYVIEHWYSEFAAQPLMVFRIDQGGLMFFGGAIAAALTVMLYVRLKKEPLLPLADVVLAVLPLGHAFGRIGCFMHGCCHGQVTDSLLGVCFPAKAPAWWMQLEQGLIKDTAEHSLPVMPTQLIESGANFLLFTLLFILQPRLRTKPGLVTALYLAGYGIIRFSVETLRGDARMSIGPFSISQTIALAALASALILAVVKGASWQRTGEPA